MKKTKKGSGYSKKTAVKDTKNPNRDGKSRPLINYSGKSVSRGK